MDWLKLHPEALPDPTEGPFLCTNNIKGRNAHGRPSHIWLTNMFHVVSGDDRYGAAFEGEPACFAEPSLQQVYGLTHYAVVDEPKES